MSKLSEMHIRKCYWYKNFSKDEIATYGYFHQFCTDCNGDGTMWSGAVVEDTAGHVFVIYSSLVTFLADNTSDAGYAEHEKTFGF